MATPESRLEQILRWRVAGLSGQSIQTTATQLWDLPSDDARKEQRRAMSRFALEVTKLDVLAELMLKYRQQEHSLDIMSRELKRDDLPASYYNTHRRLLKDSCATLTLIHELRDKEGRNCFSATEKRAEKRREEQRQAQSMMASGEYQRHQGYHYDHRHGMIVQPDDMCSLSMAIRDIIRMRMLPKSPYEDYMIMQALDALTEDEKKIDPEKLSKQSRETSLHHWDPYRDAVPGVSPETFYSQLTQRVFLERVQEYNKVWAQAEAHVDGLMAAKGILPPPDAPYVGLPPIVKKAAEGNADAIKELKDIVAAAREPGAYNWTDREESRECNSPWSINRKRNVAAEARTAASEETERTKQDESAAAQLHERYLRDFGPPTSIVVALLLAFTSAWMCFNMVLGPTMYAEIESVGCCRAGTVEALSNVRNPARRTESSSTFGGARWVLHEHGALLFHRSTHPTPLESTCFHAFVGASG